MMGYRLDALRTGTVGMLSINLAGAIRAKSVINANSLTSWLQGVGTNPSNQPMDEYDQLGLIGALIEIIVEQGNEIAGLKNRMSYPNGSPQNVESQLQDLRNQNNMRMQETGEIKAQFQGILDQLKKPVVKKRSTQR